MTTYRARLRAEGGVLALSGAAAAALVLVLADEATDGPWSTVGQLAVVAALLAALGPRAVRRSLDAAEDVPDGRAGRGEPTPLWQLPLIVAGLTLGFGLLAGWDAGLRASAGAGLVGLTQAVLLEQLVAARERRTGGAYVRLPGSRILRGTRLGRLARGAP